MAEKTIREIVLHEICLPCVHKGKLIKGANWVVDTILPTPCEYEGTNTYCLLAHKAADAILAALFPTTPAATDEGLAQFTDAELTAELQRHIGESPRKTTRQILADYGARKQLAADFNYSTDPYATWRRGYAEGSKEVDNLGADAVTAEREWYYQKLLLIRRLLGEISLDWSDPRDAIDAIHKHINEAVDRWGGAPDVRGLPHKE